jgi:hypothetical protein
MAHTNLIGNAKHITCTRCGGSGRNPAGAPPPPVQCADRKACWPCRGTGSITTCSHCGKGSECSTDDGRCYACVVTGQGVR